MHEMPRPTEVHARLHALAGDWEGEEIMFPSPFDPAGGKAKGRVRARMQLGGFYLIADYEQSVDGRPNFHGHGVYGWDPRGRCYTLHWFDSSGIEHGAPALGTWENDTLVLQYELTQFGFSRQIYTVAADEYLLTLQNSRDGKDWSTFLEGRYQRV